MILESEQAAAIARQQEVEAMDALSLSSGTIVTEDQRDRLVFGKRRIDIVPFCDWRP